MSQPKQRTLYVARRGERLFARVLTVNGAVRRYHLTRASWLRLRRVGANAMDAGKHVVNWNGEYAHFPLAIYWWI